MEKYKFDKCRFEISVCSDELKITPLEGKQGPVIHYAAAVRLMNCIVRYLQIYDPETLNKLPNITIDVSEEENSKPLHFPYRNKPV